MVITTTLRNFRDTGHPFSVRQYDLFRKDIYELAASDAIMIATTFLDLPLHLVFKNSTAFLAWNKGGMWIQSLFQAIWLLHWVTWPFVRDWTWTAQVFFTLHLLCLFMKMHSYAFYNGHLATTLARLNALDKPVTDATSTAAAVKYPSSRTPLDNITDGLTAQRDPTNQDMIVQNDSTNQDIVVQREPSKQDTLAQLRDDLALELISPFGKVIYPQNVTLSNFADFLLCPTLCYELEYPRTAKRDYMEIFYKTCAVFGCIFLLIIVTEAFILPVLDESAIRMEHHSTWEDAALIFAETVSWLLFPFMLTFLLVFFVIFEYILGAFAEITRKSRPVMQSLLPPKLTLLVQSLQTASSIRIGGTVSTGLSFRESGTSPSTTSSAAMCTAHH